MMVLFLLSRKYFLYILMTLSSPPFTAKMPDAQKQQEVQLIFHKGHSSRSKTLLFQILRHFAIFCWHDSPLFPYRSEAAVETASRQA